MTAAQKENLIESLKAWVFPIVLAGLMALVQMQYSNIVTDLKEVKVFIQKSDRNQALYEREFQYLQKKIEEHERWLEGIDKELYGRGKR